MSTVITIALFVLVAVILFRLIRNNWAAIVRLVGISSLVVGGVWLAYYYGEDIVDGGKKAFNETEAVVDTAKKKVEKSTAAKDAARKVKDTAKKSK